MREGSTRLPDPTTKWELGEGSLPVRKVGELAHKPHIGSSVVDETERRDHVGNYAERMHGGASERPEQAGLSLHRDRIRCPSTWSASSGPDFSGEHARVADAEKQRARWIAERRSRPRAPLRSQALLGPFASSVRACERRQGWRE